VEIEPIASILQAELGSPLSYPTIVANWNTENVTELSFIQKSHVFEVNGTKVGVVGVIGAVADGVAPADFRGIIPSS